MSDLLKKLTLSFLSALIVLFSFAPYLSVRAVNDPGNSGTPSNSSPTTTTTPAQTGTWYNSNFSDWFNKVYNPNVSPTNEIFGERYTAAQVQWVVFGLIALLVNSTGDTGTQAVSCLMSGDLDSCAPKIEDAINNFKLSDSGASTWASAWSVNRMSGVGYIKEKIDNFHLIPEAKAQGFGYSAIDPIRTLWTAVRNLAFGLIILVVIVMAFMIMFRVKISPQTVITVQSALPKIIFALILITFSYAIAGFMVDLMYVAIGLVATFLSSSGSGISKFSAPELFNFLNTTSILALMLNYLFYFTLGTVVVFFSTTTGILWGLPGALVGAFIAAIMFFALLVVLGIAVLKIFWLLLKTYVSILLQIAIGPLQILLGTITTFGGFGAWLKELAANLAVYPVIGFMFVLSFYFLAQAYGSILQGSGPIRDIVNSNFPFRIALSLPNSSSWSPPLTVGAGGALAFLWLGASLVVLTLIPKTADIIKGLITGKPFAYGTAIGEALGPAKAVGLYGTAETLNKAEEIGRGAARGTYVTPASIQTLRRLLGLKTG